METIKKRAELCQQYQEIYGGNFATAYIMGATEQHKIDEEENGKALLYAVNKTADRTRKEVIEKAVRWLEDNINKYLYNDNSNGKYRDWLKCSSQAFVDFRKAMD